MKSENTTANSVFIKLWPDVKHWTLIRYFAFGVIETEVFQLPQLHKHFNVSGNTMRILFTFLVIIGFILPSAGQKFRYEGDESTFLCKGDSIDYVFLQELKLQGVDTILTALYDSDNGRSEHSKHFILWRHNGISWLKTFNGCDKITAAKSKRIDLNRILSYIDRANFKAKGERIKTELIMSHDMGYFISIQLPEKKIEMNVRDYQRQKSAGKQKAITDTRVILANMLDDLFK